jgi:hypothetical protein
MLRYLTALFFGIIGMMSILYFFAAYDADMWAAREGIDTTYKSEFVNKLPYWFQRHNKKLYISQEPVSEPIFESRIGAILTAGYKRLKESFGINNLQEKFMQKHCDNCQAYQDLKTEEEYLRAELRRVKNLFNSYIDHTKFIIELNEVLGPEYQETLDELVRLRREYNRITSIIDNYKNKNAHLKNTYIQGLFDTLIEHEEPLQIKKKYVKEKENMRIQYEGINCDVERENNSVEVKHRNYVPTCILAVFVGLIVPLGVRFIIYDVLGADQTFRIYVKIRDMVWWVLLKIYEYSYLSYLKDKLKKLVGWFKGSSGA